jgi:hypothetical protein
MRTILHLACLVILLPYLALAAGFLLFGHAVASGSLGAFLLTLLQQAVLLVSWGGLAIVAALLVIAALGFWPATRGSGALCVCALALASLAVLLVGSTAAIGADQLLFLLPCFVAAFASGWLAVREWPASNA